MTVGHMRNRWLTRVTVCGTMKIGPGANTDAHYALKPDVHKLALDPVPHHSNADANTGEA